MKEISVQELKEKMDNNEDFQLIDVREEGFLSGYALISISRILDDTQPPLSAYKSFLLF